MSLQTITGGGAFTRQNISDINANFQALQSVDLWVRPQAGNNNDGNGSYDAAYATMAGVSKFLEPGIVIGVSGVLFEEYSSPRVNNVTIVGDQWLPRQATTSGVANGGGATWLSPSGGTGALLQPNGQGWTVQNLFFNNSATAAGCVKLVNAGDPPTSNCSEKFSAFNCIFTGADDGIAATDQPNHILIDGCTFFGFVGSGDTAISSAVGAGTGTLRNWRITNCTFYDNVNGIVVPLTYGYVTDNVFVSVGATVTATTLLSLTGGTGNTIVNNKFGLASDASGIATIVAMGTSPNAGPSFYNDVTEYGQPAE